MGMKNAGISCDVGGDFEYVLGSDRPPVFTKLCGDAPTHRYQGPGMVAGHWGHRCGRHVGWLDASLCTIEPLASAR